MLIDLQFISLFIQLLLKDIANKSPELRDILHKGDKILRTTTPSKHSQDLTDTTQAIRDEWEDLNRLANARGQQIDASVRHGQAYQDQLDKILLWLQFGEDKLRGTEPSSLDRDAINKKLKDAQVRDTPE